MTGDRSLQTFDALWTQIGDIEAPDGDWRQTLRVESHGTIPPLPPMTIDQGVDNDADLLVTRVLGQGGMGTVFLATQRSLEREVAIKQLKPNADESHRMGLLREGRFMGTLEHPNIVPVHAMGLDQEGLPTLVMKRVEGTSWSELLADPSLWDAHGTWPADPVMRSVMVLTEVCKALLFAHSRGIVHRDVKPANVMVGQFGEVYVVDWGVACHWERPSASRRVVGTPAYMSPEMVDPERPITPQTDVYLLGACLYEVLTGHPPHGGPDLHAVLEMAHTSAPPELPEEAPGELGLLCQQAMAAHPAARLADVTAFRSGLAAFVQHRSSARLAAEADDRRAIIEALLADAPNHDGALALFREAEFAYRQALVEWSDSPRATSGLGQLIELRIRWKLDRGDPEGASADLDVAAELGLALDEALSRRIGAAREEWETLRFRAQQEDLRTNYGPRRVYVISVLVVLCFAGLAQSERLMSPLVQYDAGWLLLLAVVLGSAITGVQIAFSDRLLPDRASQRVLWLMRVNGGIVLFHRTWAWWVDTEPWRVLGTDMILSGLTCFLMAVFVRRSMWAWGAITLSGAAAVAFLPGWAGEIYVAGAMLILLHMTLFDRSDEMQ